MTATAVLVATPDPEVRLPEVTFDDAELFFFQEACLYIEDTHQATLAAIERAGAERLGFKAGVVFEWDTVYEAVCGDADHGCEYTFDCVEMTIGKDLIHYEEYPNIDTDEIRRVLEADLIITHIDKVLLSAGE